jgi:hypothetical protein
MKEKEVELKLKFSKHIYRIMKMRKCKYIKKNKIKNLTWEDYLKIIVLCYGDL